MLLKNEEKKHYFYHFLIFFSFLLFLRTKKNHFVLRTITRTRKIFYTPINFILLYPTMTDNSQIWPSKLDENQIKDHSDVPAHHKTVEEINKDVYTAPGDVSNVSAQKISAEGNSSNDAPNSHAIQPKSLSNESAVSQESVNRPK